MRTLTLPVQSISNTRNGYSPFRRTIGDVVKENAQTSVGGAFLSDSLDAIRKSRPARNHSA